MGLKSRWTMKVDRLGLLADVELGFLVRVYKYGSLSTQPMVHNNLVITDINVELINVQDLDNNQDAESDTPDEGIAEVDLAQFNTLFLLNDVEESTQQQSQSELIFLSLYSSDDEI